MVDTPINQAAVDAYNQVLDFKKYPETGLPPIIETTPVPTVTIPNSQIINTSRTVVQDFDNGGKPKPIVSADAAAQQLKDNFAKAFAGQPADTSSNAPTSSGDSTVLSPYMIAMKQKGFLQEKGFGGDQSITNENMAFDNVVGLAAGLISAARSLSSTTASGRASRTKYGNYYLYDNEKDLLQKVAIKIASIGVVPYDVVEEFLYILVTVDNPNDMYYIATVVGVYDLTNPNIIREPVLILSVKDLYKVGYLANGVASVVMQYGTKFSQLAAADHQASPFSTLQNLAAVSGHVDALGGFQAGAAAASLIGGAAPTAIGGNLLNASIKQFPIVDIASSLVGDVISQVATITGLTAAFSTFGTVGGTIGKALDLAAIASLSSLASQTSNLNAMVASTTSVLSQSGVASMTPIVGQLNQLVRQTRDMSHHANQLSGITTLPQTIGKKSDITGQMNKVLSMSTNIASLASSISGLLGKIPSPGNIGMAANININKLGGTAPSGILTELTLGQRIPPSVLYKNPQMEPPSYAGKAFFGEAGSAQAAVDQIFCKRMGAFPSNQNGSGTSSFGMQNFGSLGGATSLSSMVSKALLGTLTPPSTGILANMVTSKTNNLSNLLNVSSGTQLEARRSDNAIPYMIAMASVLVNDTASPVPTNVHSEGWKLAASVGNDVQKYNPNFLSTCITSL
jgi:hypothetical protein